MGAYVLRRLLLIVPTLFGILLVNFVLVQFMPGGPIEQVIAELESQTSATDRITGGGGGDAGGGSSEYRGAQGLPPEFIAELERQFGFDKPAWQRFLIMLGNYLTFDFGESYFRSISRRRPRAREDAGLDHPRPLVDAARLPDLDPARHPQGGPGRHPLRHRDQRRHHRRLRHPVASSSRSCCSCSSPAAPTGASSRCAASPPTTGRSSRSGARCSTTSGTSPCR